MRLAISPMLLLVLIIGFAIICVTVLIVALIRLRMFGMGNPSARVALITSDGEVISEAKFKQRKVTIGRKHENDLVVGSGDEEVSRFHATVEYRDTKYILQDHSKNGVMLNDRYLYDDEVVRPGETFIIPRNYCLQIVLEGQRPVILRTNHEKGNKSSSGPPQGPFELGQKLSKGGQAVVYEANWKQTGEKCVVKYLLGSEFEDKFRQQVRHAPGIRHIHCVRTLGGDADVRTPWLAEEFLSGGTLALRLQNGQPLPFEETRRILGEVCDGLNYLHTQQDIIHRDITPSNIMFDGSGIVKLIDFGVAHFGNDPTFTLSGKDIVGKLKYLSPEQVKGESTTPATDIYSLGVVGYQMLTGRLPFDGDAKEVMNGHAKKRPQEPVEINPRVPKKLNDVVMCALEKSLTDRFASAEEMANELGYTFSKSPVQKAVTYPLRLRDISMGIMLPEITHSPFDIGREFIDAADNYISAIHCRVKFVKMQDGKTGWVIQKQQPDNQTIVGGKDIGMREVPLEPDTVIELGSKRRQLKVME